ncbi:hypothetical protein D3C85_97600 [compost metagenome]
MRRFAVGILIVLILPLTACTLSAGDGGYHDYPRYGGHYPPPSHGHWRWDDDLRVYINVGSPYLYYHDHTYYRWYGDRWSSGPRFNGPWRVIEHRHVPSRLGQRHRPAQRHYDDRRTPDRYWDHRDDRSDRRAYRDQRDQRDLRDFRGQSEQERRREALHGRSDERRDLRQGQQWQQPRFERQERQTQQQRFEQQRRQVEQRFEGRQQPQWRQPREEHRAQEWGDGRRHESRQQGSEPRQRQERRTVIQSNRQDGGQERRSQSRPQQERQGGRQWEGRGER